jgi:GTP cyclohydrolase II
MSLAPTPVDLWNRALSDLCIGLPVVLAGPGGGAVILAAERATEARIAALSGAHLAVTARRAETLKARAYDGDLARIKLPDGAGQVWVRGVADPSLALAMPLAGPFLTVREGDAALARLGIRLAKTAHLLPAVLVKEVADPANFAAANQLTLMQVADVQALLSAIPEAESVVSAKVPLEVSRAGRLHVFQVAGEEHYAVEIGAPSRSAPVLTRLHSACFTGDLLGSLKCDCGAQLKAALSAMGEAGEGVLLYLNQEGRGIGLANKMRAYFLQDQGFDTVEANHRLGFEDDERDFRVGAAILKRMGFSAVRLMTNNPAKSGMLAAQGIEVIDRVPLQVGRNDLNDNYLNIKAKKSGHLL